MSKQNEFVDWVVDCGYSSIVNIVERDSKGDFLDITANRIFDIYSINKVQAVKAIDEIIKFKVSMLKEENNNEIMNFLKIIGCNDIGELKETNQVLIFHLIESIKSFAMYNNNTYIEKQCDGLIKLIQDINSTVARC